MRVTVEGRVMEISEMKDGRYTVALYQPGESQLCRVRCKENGYEVGDQAVFTGRVVAWRTRDGIGLMVLAE